MERGKSRIPLIAVVGPTASGKTRLGIELALRYGGEVVSADSMQVYRGMDIGTAKPTEEEKRGVPHHLIDVADPWDNFSVAEYAVLARAAVEDIHKRGRLPILVGGTGLYISSLLSNIEFGAAQRDEELRKRLKERAQAEGGAALLAELARFDPETASRLHPNNIGRIIRAIEVYMTSGVTMAEIQRRSRLSPSPYDSRRLGLYFPERTELYTRINLRVDKMMESGLLDEVRSLYALIGVRGATSMQAIGYKELAAFLDGACGLDEAVSQIKMGTRRYAKRQMTWFRADKEILWLNASQNYEIICKQATMIVDNFLPL